MVVKVGFESELVSISRAAKVLGVSVNTLRNWERQSYIQPFRLNGRCHRRYDLSYLRQLKRLGTRSYRPAGKKVMTGVQR